MNNAKTDLKAELDKSTKLLKTLRDEVRVQLHLGGLEVKDEWRRLEPRLESVLSEAAKNATDASRTAVEDITTAVKKFRDSLR